MSWASLTVGLPFLPPSLPREAAAVSPAVPHSKASSAQLLWGQRLRPAHLEQKRPQGTQRGWDIPSVPGESSGTSAAGLRSAPHAAHQAPADLQAQGAQLSAWGSSSASGSASRSDLQGRESSPFPHVQGGWERPQPEEGDRCCCFPLMPRGSLGPTQPHSPTPSPSHDPAEGTGTASPGRPHVS